MKTILKLTTGFAALVMLAGCVEFKDADDETPQAPEPMVEVQSMGNLVVDKNLYIWNGKIVTEEEMLSVESGKNKDFEFQFDELRLEENGVLYTMGNNVRIHANRFVSAKGRIATFPKNMKAQLGEEGRSGGHILLDLGVAVGGLTIEMRGESGGDGIPAKYPDFALKGPKGKDGRSERFCQRRRPEALLPFDYSGAEGLKGLPGYPGGDGKKGGATGTLEISIEDSSRFVHNVEKVPGVGGMGKPGGVGGDGGDGGNPTVDSRGQNCGGTRGLMGPRGDKGPDGKNGANGEVQTSCITKNKIMNCSN